ncbi:hypothetical protein [Amycolatopsis sp. NPDC051903]|uniref:hypothetical protein n=1 Tax=Amycolatopsis sp. NPDC051903 TaxID=3363936 RepID=UPI0037A6CE8F
MARFQRLTRDDLTKFTRDELLPRLEAEQQYWARKEKRGLSAVDRQARKEFSDLVHAVINPSELADSMAETTAWLKGERTSDSTYFKEKPDPHQR